jgi:hypothetical protein
MMLNIFVCRTARKKSVVGRIVCQNTAPFLFLGRDLKNTTICGLGDSL